MSAFYVMLNKLLLRLLCSNLQNLQRFDCGSEYLYFMMLKDLWCVNFAAYLQQGVLCFLWKKKTSCMSVCPLPCTTVYYLSKSFPKKHTVCKDLTKNWHQKGRTPKIDRCFWIWSWIVCIFSETNIKRVCLVKLWDLSLARKYLDFVKTFGIWLLGSVG